MEVKPCLVCDFTTGVFLWEPTVVSNKNNLHPKRPLATAVRHIQFGHCWDKPKRETTLHNAFFNHCDHWKVPTESDFSQWLCHPEHKNFGFFSNGVLPLETSNGYGAKEMSASDLGWWSIKKWTLSIRGFPTLGVPKNGWSMIGNPFKVDDLGVPPYWFPFEPSP